MKSILVVDDMAVFSEPIAASLRLAGYETQCAADGEEALRLTRTNHPHVILLDIAMPTMDGITFLKRLRAEPAIANTHVILLTAHSEKSQILAAGSLGVKDFVLKSRFHLDDLLERIKKVDAPAASAVALAGLHSGEVTSKPKIVDTPSSKKNFEIPRLLTRDQFLDRVERVFQAKTLSGVIAEVIAVAGSTHGDTTELAALISRDPMLSARVLQTANSAIYATSRAVVTTIPDAIRKVGYTAVRNIAATLGVFDCMPDVGTDGFNPIRYWQHSLAVAQICERLASKKAADESGLAHMVGLCHDLGDIFIRTQFGKEYQQFMDAAAQTERPIEQLHGQMLGMTRVQMIGAVLKCMSLPEAIRKPIETLHSPGAAQSTHPLVQILWMAENYANAAMLASGPGSEVAPLSQSFCRAAIGEPKPSLPDPQALRSQVLSLTVTLAKLSRNEEAKLLAPMFKPQTVKCWIARDPRVSELDPVGMALESLTKVSINNRLPANQEIEEMGGLLVVASSTNVAGFSRAEIDGVNKKVQAAGRTLPVLAVTCGELSAEHQAGEISWRTSVTLSELATFLGNPDKSILTEAK
jgi:CheY-like chemotaxis protein